MKSLISGEQSPPNTILVCLVSPATERLGVHCSGIELWARLAPPSDRAFLLYCALQKISFQLLPLPFILAFYFSLPFPTWLLPEDQGGEGRVIAWFTANTCLSVLPQCLIQMVSLPPLLPFGPLVSVPRADFHHPIRNNTFSLLPFLWEP